MVELTNEVAPVFDGRLRDRCLRARMLGHSLDFSRVVIGAGYCGV